MEAILKSWYASQNETTKAVLSKVVTEKLKVHNHQPTKCKFSYVDAMIATPATLVLLYPLVVRVFVGF